MHCLPSSRPHFRLSCTDVRKPLHLLPTTQSNLLGRERNAPPTISSESIGNNFHALVFLLSSQPQPSGSHFFHRCSSCHAEHPLHEFGTDFITTALLRKSKSQINFIQQTENFQKHPPEHLWSGHVNTQWHWIPIDGSNWNMALQVDIDIRTWLTILLTVTTVSVELSDPFSPSSSELFMATALIPCTSPRAAANGDAAT